MNGDGGRAEMDAIGNTVTGTDTTAEVAAGNVTESGGRGKGKMKRSHDLDAIAEDTGAGAQVEMEIDTGDANAQKGHVVGAAVVIIGDAVEVEMQEGTKSSIAEGPLRGGGAQAPGIGADAETAWIRLAARGSFGMTITCLHAANSRNRCPDATKRARATRPNYYEVLAHS